MNSAILSALLVSVKVATVATLVGLLPATWLGYVLARSQFRGKSVISSLCSLPLVVPPTAVGYLLLRLFAFDGPLGRNRLGFDLTVLMTWRAAVVATCVMSFPLIVKTTRVAFETSDARLSQIAQTLGHSPLRAFLRFTLPMARRGIAAAAALGFTRAVGEFGATITVAGNIAGETTTLAAAIWSAQEVGASSEATVLICLSVAIGLMSTLLVEHLVVANRATSPGLRTIPSDNQRTTASSPDRGAEGGPWISS